MQDEVFCMAGFTYSQKITEKANIAKGKKTFEEMVPAPYRDFAKVFSEEESQRLPDHQPWDHMIDLEPDAVMRWKIKSYPMCYVTVETFTRRGLSSTAALALKSRGGSRWETKSTKCDLDSFW
jgi:hypothetical protein